MGLNRSKRLLKKFPPVWTLGILALSLFSRSVLGEELLENTWHKFQKCMRGQVDSGSLAVELEGAWSGFTDVYLRKDSIWKQAGLGAMRSALLITGHTDISENQAKLLTSRAKEIGEELLGAFSEDGDVIFWYIACLGRWAEAQGILKAAREGLADKVKLLAETLVAMKDPKMQARGHRILGRTHFKAPYIPFVLTWPSNKSSIHHLRISLKLDPENPMTRQFLAEVLYKEGEKKAAIELLAPALNRKPRPEFFLADQKNLAACRSLHQKWTGI